MGFLVCVKMDMYHTQENKTQNMKNNNIKIKYDNEADVLNWELSKNAKIDYASEMGNIIVHFTKNHIPVLIEVLEASKFLKKSVRSLDISKNKKEVLA